MTRQFEDKPATREKVPLLVGLYGTSGSGKTYSALRLASGMQQVNGGEIFVIDTEAKRSLHYADQFKFRHVEFRAPFGPLDYLSAIQHCADKGASVIVVDSMSHEHEGPGGVLEMHETEQQRLAGDNAPQWKLDAVNFSAWARPKAERQRLINTMLQFPCNFILCFRAKEKIKLASKAEKEAARANGDKIDAVKQMGFMPIGDPSFVYEMMVSCLLYPGAGGVPTWNSNELGEKMLTKLPGQFRDLFAQNRPLDESIGETMAKWASGAPTGLFAELKASIGNSESLTDLESLLPRLKEIPKNKTLPPAEYKALQRAYGDRQKELQSSAPDDYEDSSRQPGDDSDIE